MNILFHYFQTYRIQTHWYLTIMRYFLLTSLLIFLRLREHNYSSNTILLCIVQCFLCLALCSGSVIYTRTSICSKKNQHMHPFSHTFSLRADWGTCLAQTFSTHPLPANLLSFKSLYRFQNFQLYFFCN